MDFEIFKLSENNQADNSVNQKIFGRKIGFFVRLFGCWHFKISRPLTIEKETYCVCTNCGARIRFDTETLKTVGNYYFPTNHSLYPDN